MERNKKKHGVVDFLFHSINTLCLCLSTKYTSMESVRIVPATHRSNSQPYISFFHMQISVRCEGGSPGYKYSGVHTLWRTPVNMSMVH